jgi:acetyl-CoA C-acetyltransferase
MRSGIITDVRSWDSLHRCETDGDLDHIPSYAEIMRQVAVVGIGKTAFGAFPDRDLRSLAVEAGQKALENAGAKPSQVEAFYLGNFAGPSFVGQNHLAPYVSAGMGITGIPATRFEAACASSGSAFFHAVSAVAAGLYDVILITGVEKMTSQPTPKVTEILAGAGDLCGEVRAGATFPALFAMIARRHMYQYGTTREQMAAVAVKNHANGAKNPLAHMRKVITMEQALNGKPISEPLTVYDCSLISDGAAAVLIAPLERASEFTDKPVRILGISQASDNVALDEKDDITTLRAVKISAEKAYKMAGMQPADIQFAEVHDCFTIAEIVAIEDLGFVTKGEGGPYSLAGKTCIQGERPVNTSGGLKAKGHPVGATGVGQICDVVQQIRGEAGERQVQRNSIGLAQNLGGSGATSVITILGAA